MPNLNLPGLGILAGNTISVIGLTGVAPGVIVSGNDQANTRIRITNTAAAKSYDFMVGLNASSNDGVSIFNMTDAINLAHWTSTGAMTIPASLTVTAGGITVVSGASSLNDLTLNSGSKLAIQNMTAPGSNPGAGFYLYSDVADGKLKARSAAGTVTVLALL